MRKLIIICLSIVLCGCGFHLRGLVDPPLWLNNVSIISQNVHRNLAPLLTNLLSNSRINTDPRLSTYWIILEEDSLKQHISSVSSSTNARQYQLVYSLRFKLENNQNHHASDSQTITVIRQLTVNSERILGSTDEQSILENEMHQEAVQLLFDRLGSAP